MKIFNWGIIGVGDVCEVKSGPAYQKTEGFILKSVMRRDLSKAKDFAQRHGVEKFTDNADELINDPEIDAIYIATPPDTHLTYALKVARAGKICCVEKPMAMNYNESEQMFKAFATKNIPLFIAYYRRSLPRFVQIKKWLEANEIGQIRHIDWTLCQPPNLKTDGSADYNWRTDGKIAPGGYFDDLASHGLDLFHYFLGEIQSASGQSTNQQNLYTAKDAVAASWIHKNGATGTGFWNFGTWESKDKVCLYGQKGTICFSVFNDCPVELIRQNGKKSLYIRHPENVQLSHVQNMSLHLQGILEHPSTGLTGLHTAWVMDKILNNKIE